MRYGMTADRYHPAQFSPEVLDAIAPIIAEWRLPVHDPFAGPGLRLGRLCDQLNLKFTGTEIEQPFAVDRRVTHDDSTLPYTYPLAEHCIVTSPAYPNGMSDHFHAKDGSKRHTYRQGLAAVTGEDRKLRVNNMGRYGVRAGNKALRTHLMIAGQAVAHWWPAKALVNVSDFVVAGEPFQLVDHWRRLLECHRYVIADEVEVKTRRQRYGANGGARADHEVVLVAMPERR